MISKIKLGVNIDHVATIRNARGGMHPDPVKAALIAQNTGADNITAHLREDRRHISDIDIKKLMQKLRIPSSKLILIFHPIFFNFSLLI